MRPPNGMEWIVFAIGMLALLLASLSAVRMAETGKGKFLCLFILSFIAFLICASLIGTTEKANDSFLYCLLIFVAMMVIGIILKGIGRIVVLLLSLPVLLTLFVLSPNAERYTNQRQEAQLRYELTIKQQAQALSDYLCGKEIDCQDAWWLTRQGSELHYMATKQNEEIFLKAISAVEGREITDLQKWWFEEGGQGKLKFHFTVRLKEGPLPSAEKIEEIIESENFR